MLTACEGKRHENHPHRAREKAFASLGQGAPMKTKQIEELKIANERLEYRRKRLFLSVKFALRVAEAHCKDLNPHFDLLRGESADFDAAVDVAKHLMDALDYENKQAAT